MIEHVDTALASWLATIESASTVRFERRIPTGDDESVESDIVLVLGRISEQVDKRDNRIADVRDDDGAVSARQRPERYFELDYSCGVTGPAPRAHRTVGALVQLLVDRDTIPADHVPAPLAALGIPLPVELVAPTVPGAAITVRVVLPIRPAADRDVSAPATSLHLDVSRPDAPTTGQRASSVVVPIEQRRWTTVRRRELIGRRPEGT